LLSNDAHGANHFRLAQAGIMNIYERKRTSASPSAASPRASQPIADGHFVHSRMDFCSKICSSKRLLERFEDIAIR